MCLFFQSILQSLFGSSSSLSSSNSSNPRIVPNNNNSNNKRRAKRIILCRHGESLGNVDVSTYVHTADWRIPLTERGKEQSRNAGRRLANLLRGERCFIYYSPYQRTVETMEEMIVELNQKQDQDEEEDYENDEENNENENDVVIVGRRLEPRICEQQFGNFQNVVAVQRAREERANFGRFFYRFPSGEAGLDVYNRATSFISTIFRDMERLHDNDGEDMEKMNILIVTHGLTLRLFLMRWFQFSVDEFENSYNPDNAFLAIMERQTSDDGKYQWYTLTDETLRHLKFKHGMVDDQSLD